MQNLTAIIGAYATFIPEKQPFGFFVNEEEKGLFLFVEGQTLDDAIRFPVNTIKYHEFWLNIPSNFSENLKNYGQAKSYRGDNQKIDFDGKILRLIPIDPLYLQKLYRESQKNP